MDRLYQALYLTAEMSMFLPLAVFCLIPVAPYTRSSPPRLWAKVAAAALAAELVVFLLLFLSPTVKVFNFAQVMLSVGMFLLYRREVRLPVFRLLFVFLTACVIGGFSYLVYHIVDILLHPDGSYYVIYRPYSFLAQMIFECVFVLLVYIPAKKYLGWLVSSYQEERIWRNVWIFPAVFTVFSYFFVPYNNSYMYLGRFMRMYFVFLILMFVIVLTLYSLFYKIARVMTEKSELLMRSAYLEVQVQQYQELQNHIQETRRLRHDFRHQLTAISEMLEYGHYDEALDYLREYRAKLPDIPKQYCASTAVNAILHHYAALCQSEDIDTSFDVALSKDFSCEDVDFCVLLGNLLENAFDGCKGVPARDRKIELHILQKTPHILVIQVSNPYSGTVSREMGRYLSSKHQGTGQGLRSVQLIAQKYKGEVLVTDQNQLFTVQVLLTL